MRKTSILFVIVIILFILANQAKVNASNVWDSYSVLDDQPESYGLSMYNAVGFRLSEESHDIYRVKLKSVDKEKQEAYLDFYNGDVELFKEGVPKNIDVTGDGIDDVNIKVIKMFSASLNFEAKLAEAGSGETINNTNQTTNTTTEDNNTTINNETTNNTNQTKNITTEDNNTTINNETTNNTNNMTGNETTGVETDNNTEGEDNNQSNTTPEEEGRKGGGVLLWISIIILALVIIAVIIIMVMKKKKTKRIPETIFKHE